MAERSAVSAPAHYKPAWEARFLEVFAATGNVRLATGAAGISRDTPYKRAQVDPAFAEAWRAAREDAVDTLEAEARRRALAGSDTLIMFLLKSLRPDVYRERASVDVNLDLRREAERIALSAGVDVEATLAEAERILAEGGV
jgi:ribosome modulation factor